MAIDVMPGGFNPMSLPPTNKLGGGVTSGHDNPNDPMARRLRRQFPTGPMVTSGHDNPNDPMARRLNRQFPPTNMVTSGHGGPNDPMTGRLNRQFPGMGGPVQSMNRMPMGNQMPMGYGGGQGMVQGPSFMQSQPDMNSMLGMMGMMSMMNNRGGGQQPMQPQQPQRNRMAGGMVDPNFRRMMEVKAAGGMGSAMAQRPGSNAQYGPGAFGVSPSLYYQHFDNQGMPRQQQQQPNFWQMYQQLLGGGGQQQGY